MRHILAFTELHDIPGGSSIQLQSEPAYAEMRLDSLVALTSGFVIRAIGHASVNLLVTKDAVGKQLPMPQVKLNPGSKLDLEIVNLNPAMMPFSAYFIVDLINEKT